VLSTTGDMLSAERQPAGPPMLDPPIGQARRCIELKNGSKEFPSIKSTANRSESTVAVVGPRS
jgi:hypothetical protein